MDPEWIYFFGRLDLESGERRAVRCRLPADRSALTGGASLEEIMQQMGWQKHTIRGFMAGPMKKAGYTVESFKSEAGVRCYRINP